MVVLVYRPQKMHRRKILITAKDALRCTPGLNGVKIDQVYRADNSLYIYASVSTDSSLVCRQIADSGHSGSNLQ